MTELKNILILVFFVFSQIVMGQTNLEAGRISQKLVLEYFEVSGLKEYHITKLRKFVRRNYKDIAKDSLNVNAIIEEVVKAESKTLLLELRNVFSKEYNLTEFQDLLKALKSPQMVKYFEIRNHVVVLNYQYGHHISEDKMINKLVDRKVLDEKHRRLPVAPPIKEEE